MFGTIEIPVELQEDAKRNGIKKFYNSIEGIKLVDKDGNEWWNSRQLAGILEYPTDSKHYSDKFGPVIEKAKESMEVNKINISKEMLSYNEFSNIYDGDITEVSPPIGGETSSKDIGVGGRPKNDVYLSRKACYFICINCRSDKKPMAAIGQQYFVVSAITLEELIDNVNVLSLIRCRKALTESEELLISVLLSHWVPSHKLGTIKSTLDECLFNKPTKELKEQFNIPNNKPLADYFDNTILLITKHLIIQNILSGIMKKL